MWRFGLQTAVLYVGAVVGAGFASGQEVVQFFGIHTDQVLIVSMFVAGSFAIMGLLVMVVCWQRSIGDYGALARFALGDKLGSVYELLLTVCLVAGLAIMLAGAGALVEQELKLSARIGTLATAMIIYLILLGRVSGAIIANAILVPVLVVIVMITCLTVPRGDVVPVFVRLKMATGGHWAESAVLYVLYNLQLAAVALAPVARAGVPASARALGMIGGGVTLGGLVGIMMKAISHSVVTPAEVPMSVLAHQVSESWGAVYGLALWCALLTTGVAAALGLQVRLAISPVVGGFMVLVPAVLIAEVGFSSLVSIVYPLMGYLSLPLMSGIVIRFACSSVIVIRRHDKRQRTGAGGGGWLR